MKKVIFFVAFVIITGFCFGQKLGATKTITVQLFKTYCDSKSTALFFKEKSGEEYVFNWRSDKETSFDMKYRKYWEYAFENNNPCDIPKNEYYQCRLKWKIIEKRIDYPGAPVKIFYSWVVIGLKKINR